MVYTGLKDDEVAHITIDKNLHTMIMDKLWKDKPKWFMELVDEVEGSEEAFRGFKPTLRIISDEIRDRIIRTHFIDTHVFLATDFQDTLDKVKTEYGLTFPDIKTVRTFTCRQAIDKPNVRNSVMGLKTLLQCESIGRSTTNNILYRLSRRNIATYNKEQIRRILNARSLKNDPAEEQQLLVEALDIFESGLKNEATDARVDNYLLLTYTHPAHYCNNPTIVSRMEKIATHKKSGSVGRDMRQMINRCSVYVGELEGKEKLSLGSLRLML